MDLTGATSMSTLNILAAATDTSYAVSNIADAATVALTPGFAVAHSRQFRNNDDSQDKWRYDYNTNYYRCC